LLGTTNLNPTPHTLHPTGDFTVEPLQCLKLGTTAFTTSGADALDLSVSARAFIIQITGVNQATTRGRG
jgi:hypothetical protein